jgi:hypothetical protein
LNDVTRAGKDAVFTIVTRGPQQRGDSIRTERWRYTEWSDGQRELYDHSNDPQETKNVLTKHSATADTLCQQLRAHRSAVMPPQ